MKTQKLIQVSWKFVNPSSGSETSYFRHFRNSLSDFRNIMSFVHNLQFDFFAHEVVLFDGTSRICVKK